MDIEKRWAILRARPPGLWIAATGGTVGLLYLVVQLAEEQGFFGAFMRAATVSFALMVVLALAHALASGAKLSEAGAPGGWMLKLREPITRTRRTVGLLEERVSSQMTKINDRLYDLEKAVFQDEDSGTEEQE